MSQHGSNRRAISGDREIKSKAENDAHPARIDYTCHRIVRCFEVLM